jgi:hypothetical protein
MEVRGEETFEDGFGSRRAALRDRTIIGFGRLAAGDRTNVLAQSGNFMYYKTSGSA